MPSESMTGWHFMNHAKTLMGIPSSQFIFGLVLYRPIYELTQFMIQGYEHRDAKRPGSFATRFQATAAASTMAS